MRNNTLERITPTSPEEEQPRNSFEVLRDGDQFDLHGRYMTPGLKSPEEGTEFRIESERRMLSLEAPRTLAEIKRDNAHQIGSNLEALRHQKLVAEALRQEQLFYKEDVTEPKAKQNEYDLAG